MRFHESHDAQRVARRSDREHSAARNEVTKKLWAYIKKNDLQDSKNRRNINADDKLKEVFGGKKTVSMFEMTKLVAGHLK